jgi:CheY-like chemotaxis protein
MAEKKKVMIVDDDADFVEAQKTILVNGGYEVIVAYSGQECLDLVKSNRPDIILLDMVMDTFADGTKAASRLKESAETKDIPILLISAVDLRNPIGEIEETESFLGVDGYIVKPVTPDQLLETVAKNLKTDSS